MSFERARLLHERYRLPSIFVATLALSLAACGTSESDDECSVNDDCPDGQVCSIGSCVEPFEPIGNNNTNGNTNGNVNGNNNNNAPPVIDDVGPTIVIREPDPYEVETGDVLILVDIVDIGSGVDPDSVYAIVADQVLIPLEPSTGVALGRFDGIFDSRPFANALAPSLEVVASDLNGNETVVGNSFVLDYAGPSVDMDPRDIRPYYISEDSGTRCGGLIRMLGDTALQDGQIIAPQIPTSAPDPDVYEPFFGLAFYPRAEIFDRATEGPYEDSLQTTVAGVDEDSVFFALLDQDAISSGQRLLTSNRPDNTCNLINPDVIPESNAQVLDEPVAVIQDGLRTLAGGYPDFSFLLAEFREPGITATVPPSPCVGWGVPPLEDPPALPLPVCEPVDPLLTVFLSGTVVNGFGVSRVFVANAYDSASTVTCAGGFFDAINLVADGPACVAASATDVIGNTGVSTPLYICIDKDGVGGECDGFNPTLADKLNACTDGCVPEDNSDPRVDAPIIRGF